jgi:uncharacterized protein (TIGR00290 family)
MALDKIWLSWSSGKDSAWALHALRASPQYQVTALLTTINADAGRVAMHAVREELLAAQAAALGLPLFKVPIPMKCTNIVYEEAMGVAMARAREAGVFGVAFGDLFLEDLRRYREEKLRAVGMTCLFPIWQRDTRTLARDMVASGLRAHLTCVDPKHLDRSFAGRVFDAKLLDDLPSEVDSCGENGEFHSFAFAGPMFSTPLRVTPGEIVESDGFIFADLLSANSL